MLDFLKPYFYRRFKTSFSKSGEDIQLWQLLKKERGTYIDIGGHHPKIGNNSYFFYLRGWRGIVVEPNPVFERLYKKLRPEDILLTEGIADFDGELEYYEFYSDLLNSFSKEHINNVDQFSSIKTIKKLPVKKLSTVYENNELLKGSIDFLSIDVEGLELNVLKGNDWDFCRPKYILLETYRTLIEDLNSEISNFLNEKDYSLISKSMLTKQIGTLWYKSNETNI